MAEAFINQVNRAVGIVTSSSNASIGIGLTWMSGISTAHVAIHDIVDNANFIAGTKVTLVGVSSVQLDRASTNTVAATASQVVWQSERVDFVMVRKTQLEQPLAKTQPPRGSLK